MSVNPESFRTAFRMFNDPGKYPDDTVTYYITLAMNMLAGSNSAAGNRFDPVSLDRAVGLYVAHNLALDARDMEADQTGGTPGELEGPATAKAVDKVSVSSDTKAVTWENEPYWNQTRFGIALMDLVRMFGAGGIQLGTP
jgi:hypothetical protein